MSELECDRKQMAKGLLGENDVNLSGKAVWDILVLLLCRACQFTRRQEKNIRAEWRRNMCEFDFDFRRYRSPHSLTPRRSSGLMANTAARESQSLSGSNLTRTVDDVPASPTVAALERRTARGFPGGPHHTPQRRTNDNHYTDLSSEIEPPHQVEHEECTTLELFSLPGSWPMEEEHGRTACPVPDLQYDPFRPGNASKLAPWVLRAETRKMLFEPLREPANRRQGSIYAVQVIGTPCVKIGLTRQVRERNRLKEINVGIKKERGMELDIAGARWIEGIPSAQLDRLEKLVHSDLAFCQHDLPFGTPTKTRNHQEYFRVDVVTAYDTIKLWHRIMRDLRIEVGTSVDSRIKEAVREYVEDAYAPFTELDYSDAARWTTVNYDHPRRISSWTKAVKCGLRKARLDAIVSMMMRALLGLWILYLSPLPLCLKHISFVLFVVVAALCNITDS